MSAQGTRFCSICNRAITNPKRQFCSRECRHVSLRKRILVKCQGCGKNFEILPYLKRKTNYCSVACYHQSTFQRRERKCIVCGQSFIAKACLVRQGFGKFCSLKCQHKTYEVKRILFKCWQCKKEFEKPPSVAKKNPHFCSKTCHDDYLRDYVTRICHHCGKEFELPTWETKKGKGMFCSRYCYIHYNGESTLEAKMRHALEKLKVNFQQEVKFGKFHADFVIPEKKIVIECDSYWHESKYVKERDDRKDTFLKKLGYQVFRFSETQIKKSVLECLQALQLF